MEKVYKHRKTGELAYYKDGVFKQGNCSVEIGVEPSSEFWTEISYKVLETKVYNCQGISNGTYTVITSVKRLSDGEVFSIGDKISFRGLYGNNSQHKYDIIKGFDLKQDANLGVLYHNGLVGLSKIEKYKESILTTFDGVELFDQDVYYFIWLNKPAHGQEINKVYKAIARPLEEDTSWSSDAVFFSTKESAEKYLKENQKKYSVNDIKEIVKKLGCFGTTLIEYLENENR